MRYLLSQVLAFLCLFFLFSVFFLTLIVFS